MTTPSTPSSSHAVDKAAAEVTGAAKSVKKATKEAADTVRDDASDVIEAVNEAVRKNPLPVVFGTFAFGVALGCLVMSGRHPTVQERYVEEPLEQASDMITATLNRLLANIKFW